jgi:Putative metallopeptidase
MKANPANADPVAAFCSMLARCTAAAAGVLALGLGAVPAHSAEAVSKETLEQRVIETARAIEKHPHYRRMSPQRVEQGVEFVTGNILFVISHESGHALVNELQIPVLGHEEDAVDAFATIMLLRLKDGFADRVVTNAARGWFFGDQRDKREGTKTVYYDEHGLDLQRAYAIVCLMVGYEPEKFRALADEVKLPRERQDSCRRDYGVTAWSWEKALKPYQRTPDQPKAKIAVTYGPAGSDYELLGEMARKIQILENVAEHLSDTYVWPAPIALEMKVCGSSGAQFEFATKKIVVCYEILDEFSELYRTYGHREAVAGPLKIISKHKKVVSAKSGTAKAFKSSR